MDIKPSVWRKRANRHTRMFLAVLFLLIEVCASFGTGPPYAMCQSFNTGHPDLVPSSSTVAISLLKGDQPVSCYLPAQTYTGEFVSRVSTLLC